MKLVLIVTLGLLSIPIRGYASTASRARLIWDRIVGSYQISDETKVAQMAQLLGEKREKEAAAIATAEKRFIDYTIARLASPWSNREMSQVVSYNGAVALVQGVVRDKKDFRTAFYGNFLYKVQKSKLASTISLPDLSLSNEDHFLVITNNDLSAHDVLELQTGNQYSTAVAGSFTDFSGLFTVGTARFLYDAGTNRRPIEWAFKTMLCKTMNDVFDTTRGDQYVARDIDRSDVSQYKTKCIGCHGTALDAMRDAFSYLNTEGGALKFFSTINFGDTSFKYNNNNTVFPDGHATVGNTWENLATANHNVALGWRGQTKGTGIAALAKMFTDAEEFPRCMATHVFQQVCLRAPSDEEKTSVIAKIAVEDFEAQGYQFHKLYEAVGANEGCIGE